MKAEGKCVVINDRKLEFEQKIIDAKVFRNKIIIIFEHERYPLPHQEKNLKAYTKKGKLLWAAEHPTNETADSYTHFMDRKESEELIVSNFAGYVCWINHMNGK